MNGEERVKVIEENGKFHFKIWNFDENNIPFTIYEDGTLYESRMNAFMAGEDYLWECNKGID